MNFESAQVVGSSSPLFHKLAALQQTAEVKSVPGEINAEQRAEYRKVAQGFESMFFHLLYKQMKTAMLDDPDNQDTMMSFGADTLSGYVDLQFAEHAVQQGGLGLANMIYKHLTGESMARITQDTRTSVRPLTLPSPTKDTPVMRTPSVSVHPGVPTGANFLDNVIERIRPYTSLIEQNAERYNIPAALIKSVITAESAGKYDAQSPVGAKGLMQLMDGTARDMGVSDVFNPAENIAGGARYLATMLSMFEGNTELALAAYNAGPGNVQKYDGIPPFKETQAYVKKVLRYRDMFSILENTSLRTPLT